ncbi:hypothetical protein ABPG74_018194 [Tetrahymena malaccensis]
MSSVKKIILTAFVLQIIVCFASCQAIISLGLKINANDQLYITSKFGENSCEVDLIPNLSYCSNSISVIPSYAKSCGSQIIGQNSFVEGDEYSAKFQLGQIETNLNFTIPNPSSSFFGSKDLCFGAVLQEDQDNVIAQLFSIKLILDQKFYININDVSSQSGVVGSIELGYPNQSLIKEGSNFVSLLSAQAQSSSGYFSYSNRNLTYGGQQLIGGTSAVVSLNDPFLQISNFSFKSLLQTFLIQGINYTYLPNQNYRVLLQSIEKLQDISIDLVAEDNSIYTLNIKPKDYTRQLENGQYQLLIFPTFYSNTISLGYSVLQSYYLGFDLLTQTVLVAEKADNDAHQF